MSNAPDGGGPAFPTQRPSTGAYFSGLTIRDYFASQALPSAIAQFYESGDGWDNYDDMADSIYRIADAMMRARDAAKETR